MSWAWLDSLRETIGQPQFTLLFAPAAKFLVQRVRRGNTRATTSGGPSATTLPPSGPPPGPMSMT